MSHMREQTHPIPPSIARARAHTGSDQDPVGLVELQQQHCNTDSLTEPEAASVWDIWVTSITGVPLENTLH